MSFVGVSILVDFLQHKINLKIKKKTFHHPEIKHLLFLFLVILSYLNAVPLNLIRKES